jgi:hypothetical protein
VDSERAEAHLRLVAEAELRRAAPARVAGAFVVTGEERPMARVTRVAHALTSVGALDTGTAEAILADLELAVSVRQPASRQVPIGVQPPVARRRLARMMQAASRYPPPGFTGVSPKPPAPPAPAAEPSPDRVVPVGMMIPVRDDDVRGELYLLAFSQTASGARFSMHARIRGELGHGWPSTSQMVNNLAGTDNQGTSYSLYFRGRGDGTGWTGQLVLHPDPPPGIRWLDLAIPDGPVRRIHLDPPVPGPAIAVTEAMRSPGEQLLLFLATQILASSADLEPGHRRGVSLAQRKRYAGDVTTGLGDIVEALLAAGALSPLSEVPGQLATLCESLDIRDHGIPAPPAPDLPKPWLSMLARAHLRKPDAALHGGGCAAAAVVLPEIDGVTVSILGLQADEDGTTLHVHASGVEPTPGPEAVFLPVLWIRDDTGHWHTTSTSGWQTGQDGEATAQLLIVPPLTRGASIDIHAAGRSAEVRTTLPVRWR